jgi:hypothetical protein
VRSAVFVAFLICLIGCGSDSDLAAGPLVPPSERAIAIWTEEHGEPSDTCADDARTAGFELLGPERLAAACDAPVGSVVGCLYEYDEEGADVVLASSAVGASDATRTHELLHVLLQCRSGKLGWSQADYYHEDPVWKHIGQDATR